MSPSVDPVAAVNTVAAVDIVDDAQLLESATQLRTLVAKLRRRLVEQANPGDFSASQSAVLSRLYNEGPATLTALATAEGMRPQSMSAIVSALQAAGFVTGSPDPGDGRRTILALSDHALETVEAARIVKNDWLFRTIKSRLDPEQQAQLASSIELLQRLIEP
jgi:DNA-binding MarR family transcriptional regulator